MKTCANFPMIPGASRRSNFVRYSTIFLIVSTRAIPAAATLTATRAEAIPRRRVCSGVSCTIKSVRESSPLMTDAMSCKLSAMASRTVTITPPVHSAIGCKKFSHSHSAKGLIASRTAVSASIAAVTNSIPTGASSSRNHFPNGSSTFS